MSRSDSGSMAYVDHRGCTEIRSFAYPEPLRWSRTSVRLRRASTKGPRLLSRRAMVRAYELVLAVASLYASLSGAELALLEPGPVVDRLPGINTSDPPQA